MYHDPGLGTTACMRVIRLCFIDVGTSGCYWVCEGAMVIPGMCSNRGSIRVMAVCLVRDWPLGGIEPTTSLLLSSPTVPLWHSSRNECHSDTVG